MENLLAELASEPGASSPIRAAQRSYFTPESLAGDPERLWTENYGMTALLPLLLVTGNADFVHDDSVRLDGFLLAKGIAHEFALRDAGQSGQPHVFCYDMKNPPWVFRPAPTRPPSCATTSWADRRGTQTRCARQERRPEGRLFASDVCVSDMPRYHSDLDIGQTIL